MLDGVCAVVPMWLLMRVCVVRIPRRALYRNTQRCPQSDHLLIIKNCLECTGHPGAVLPLSVLVSVVAFQDAVLLYPCMTHGSHHDHDPCMTPTWCRMRRCYTYSPGMCTEMRPWALAPSACPQRFAWPRPGRFAWPSPHMRPEAWHSLTTWLCLAASKAAGLFGLSVAPRLYLLELCPSLCPLYALLCPSLSLHVLLYRCTSPQKC